jgi:hypothetical protein
MSNNTCVERCIQSDTLTADSTCFLYSSVGLVLSLATDHDPRESHYTFSGPSSGLPTSALHPSQAAYAHCLYPSGPLSASRIKRTHSRYLIHAGPGGDGDWEPPETSAAPTHGSRCPPGRPGLTLPPSHCLRIGSPQARCGRLSTASERSRSSLRSRCMFRRRITDSSAETPFDDAHDARHPSSHSHTPSRRSHTVSSIADSLRARAPLDDQHHISSL